MIEDAIKKLNELENNPDLIPKNQDFLYSLLDSDEGSRAVELLALNYTDNNEHLFLNLLDHNDELIRIQAVEVLDRTDKSNILSKIKNIAEDDTSYLARGYAVQSVFSIYDNICSSTRDEELVLFYKNLLKKENDGWVRAVIFAKLYLLGEVEYIENIIELMKNDDYLIRISAILSLEEIVDDNNKIIIRNVLVSALEKPENNIVSVKEKIEHALKQVV